MVCWSWKCPDEDQTTHRALPYFVIGAYNSASGHFLLFAKELSTMHNLMLVLETIGFLLFAHCDYFWGIYLDIYALLLFLRSLPGFVLQACHTLVLDSDAIACQKVIFLYV